MGTQLLVQSTYSRETFFFLLSNFPSNKVRSMSFDSSTSEKKFVSKITTKVIIVSLLPKVRRSTYAHCVKNKYIVRTTKFSVRIT